MIKSCENNVHRFSFLLNKRKAIVLSSSTENSNFGSQWFPSLYWLSRYLRLFNHPRVDGHEIVHEIIQNHYFIEREITIADTNETVIVIDLFGSSVHPLPRRANRSATRKYRAGVGLVEPSQVIPYWLWKKEKRGRD